MARVERGWEGKYYTNNKMVARTQHEFPALVELYMPPNRPGGPLPKLETLKFDIGDYEKSIEGVEHLTNLREVEIRTSQSNRVWEAPSCPNSFKLPFSYCKKKIAIQQFGLERVYLLVTNKYNRGFDSYRA